MKRLTLRISLLLAVLFTFSPASAQWKRGQHAFKYTEYAPLADKPIIVHYYIPRGKIKNMDVIFVMHGAERSGPTALETWRHFAEEDGFIVIAPEYTHGHGWLENDYQFGGVYTDRTFKELNPPEKWTYNTIEAIFDHFKKRTGNRSEKYFIHGHSAGGQFVHRMMIALPEARIKLGVASNPGSWTFPLIDGIEDSNGKVHGWPFSVKGTPFATEKWISNYLTLPLIVHLGDRDTATVAKGLPTSAAAKAQGPGRYHRGINFFEKGKELANEYNVPFAWDMVVVNGVGHAGRSIVYGRSRRIQGKRVFSTDNITNSGAYNVIFKRY